MSVLLPSTFLFVLPFIQLGYSYYASVSTAGAALTLFIAGRSNFRTLWRQNLVFRSIACLLMILATASYGGASGQDVLRTVREVVAFFLVTGSASWSLPIFNSRILSRVLFAIWLFGLGTLLMVIVQTVYLRSHAYFGIPMELFSQNTNTLPGELALLYSNLRPSGTFAEPSYLGGICLSLIFAISPLLKKKRSVQLLVALLVAIVAISRSLSGILFIFLYLSIYMRAALRSPAIFYGCVVSLFGILLAVTLTDNPISDRLLTEGNYDASIMGRIFGPLEAIPKILPQYPLGIPLAPFQNMGYSFSGNLAAAEMTHNGLFNLIINYGLVGFLLVGVILFSFRNTEVLVYVLALSIQNGGFLTVDKFVIIALSIMLHNSLRASTPQRKRVDVLREFQSYSLGRSTGPVSSSLG
ncbi:hypothetical protein GPL17_22880 [Bradyrhizobium yuanmingense]|uniref:hypothetical protein n=1 Tax=Bradyrhizobium yuanmingense TaxID=108015 RepID=UPI0012FB093F|nr:hypothetical protein [Bradyrhizobium yuanmingense]MVT53320.1 hypothetical protein [Bradyrhizobium yuanmingense]